MKKLILLAAILTVSLTASAQTGGNMAAGLNLNYGISDGYNALGIGAKFQYTFAKSFRGEASFNYYLPKDDANVWDINLNVHYLIPVGENMCVYPLAGLTYMTTQVTGDTKKLLKALGAKTSDSNVGINIGCGFEYFVSSNIKLNAEVKYQYAKDSDWPVIGIGAAYVF